MKDWTDDFKEGQIIKSKSGVEGFLVRITEDLTFLIQPKFCPHVVAIPHTDVITDEN